MVTSVAPDGNGLVGQTDPDPTVGVVGDPPARTAVTTGAAVTGTATVLGADTVELTERGMMVVVLLLLVVVVVEPATAFEVEPPPQADMAAPRAMTASRLARSLLRGLVALAVLVSCTVIAPCRVRSHRPRRVCTAWGYTDPEG